MEANMLALIVPQAFTADQVLSPYVYVFYIAFAVAFVFTPIMQQVAIYYGIMDEPDRLRKMHSTPVAYLGGVAVFLGWMAGLAISQFLHLHHSEAGLNYTLVVKFSLVIGASVIVVLGLWDDVHRINPWAKIAGQVVAAVFLLADNVGTHITRPILEALLSKAYVLMHGPAAAVPACPEWLVISSSSIIVIFVVVGCCNATNLLDGLDGLCGGVTAIISAGFLFLAVHLAINSGGLSTNADALRVVLGMALLGAVLGFVPYNFNPASIFMGDTGSMFLGFAIAAQIILMGEGQHPKWFLASMVMFALPILDTALAFARRWVNGRKLFSPDRFHFHHQLVGRGFTVKKTVLISYGLAIGFAALGIAIVYVRTRYAVGAYLVIFGSIIVAAFKMGMVHERTEMADRRPRRRKELEAAPSAASAVEAGASQR